LPRILHNKFSEALCLLANYLFIDAKILETALVVQQKCYFMHEHDINVSVCNR